MPTPKKDELLTLEELTALRDALGSVVFVNALTKVCRYDARVHAESMENEALAPTPNTSLIIQYAARSRHANEYISSLKRRIDALTVKQRSG